MVAGLWRNWWNDEQVALQERKKKFYVVVRRSRYGGVGSGMQLASCRVARSYLEQNQSHIHSPQQARENVF